MFGAFLLFCVQHADGCQGLVAAQGFCDDFYGPRYVFPGRLHVCRPHDEQRLDPRHSIAARRYAVGGFLHRCDPFANVTLLPTVIIPLFGAFFLKKKNVEITGTVYPSSAKLSAFAVALDQFAVFQRAGSIVPFDGAYMPHAVRSQLPRYRPCGSARELSVTRVCVRHWHAFS
jgi:hypothetical protein